MFTAMAGWGSEVFTAHDHWWWVPVVCSHLGGLLGTALYTFVISSNGEGIEERAEKKEGLPTVNNIAGEEGD